MARAVSAILLQMFSVSLKVNMTTKEISVNLYTLREERSTNTFELQCISVLKEVKGAFCYSKTLQINVSFS